MEAPLPSSDDEAIRARISTKLRKDLGGMTEFVNVVVDQGVVDLWGTTNSPEVAEAIRVAAESTPGVQEVRHHVTVLPPMVRAALGAE